MTNELKSASDGQKSRVRRGLLKGVSGAVVFSQLPDSWRAPIVDQVLLPAHAQASPQTPKCADMDKSTTEYLENCCTRPGIDENGNYVTDSSGHYICCDSLSPNSPEYANYCCTNKAKDPTGKPVTGPDGNAVCCESSRPDPSYCCIKRSVTHSVSIPRRVTDWDLRRAIPKWDPMFGPLGRVEVKIAGEIVSQGWVESTDSREQNVTFNAEATLVVSMPGNVALRMNPRTGKVSQLLSAGGNLIVGTDDVTRSIPDGKGTDYWVPAPLEGSDSGTYTVTDPAVLPAYSGGGSAEVEVFADGIAQFSGPGNFDSSTNVEAEATVQITYYCVAS